MAHFDQGDFERSFKDWIAQQYQDLEELLNTLGSDSNISEENLKPLIEKGIAHFEEYSEKRALMAKHDAPLILSPTWCSSFENACLWIGGCRPSLSVRLVDSVCDTQLSDFLRGEAKGSLVELSDQQLEMINALYRKIVEAEDKISARFASLQEEVADKSLQVGESSRGVNRVATDDHLEPFANVIVEADKLRLGALKELVMDILTPSQAIDLLIATKKLHLSVHERGVKRDHHPGSSC